MGDRLMTVAQESAARCAAGWQWALGSGQVLRLRATGRQRWLLVTDGRLWVTATARSDDEAAEDCWLHPGQHLALPAGQEAVAEAWPSAHFEVLEAAPGSAPRAHRPGRLSAMARAWREGVQALQWTPRSPAPTSACAL
jgi:redox-sensitive bicupin YhaK (pirin superfamily)